MTKRFLFLGVAALAAVSCERIPPSVSIPGYGQKHAAEQHAAAQPLGSSAPAPSYFPQTAGPAVSPAPAAMKQGK